MKNISVLCGEWGAVKFIRSIPRNGDDWGEFRQIAGTELEKFVTVVDSETLSNAIMGHYMPLVKKLGPSPDLVSKRISDRFLCDWHLDRSCPTRSKNCKPGLKTPLCFRLSRFDEDVVQAVMTSIREGFYLLVVTGEEE